MNMLFTQKQIDMLGVMTTVKFVATAGGGQVNVAPILTLNHYRDNLLIFGDFLMVKTKKNLLENHRVSVLVMDEEMNYFTVGGTFQGFETKGEVFDLMNSSPMLKYNAYTGIRSVGIIRAESVAPVAAVSKLKIVTELLAGIIPGRKMGINRVVGEKFERVKALKALAFLEEEGPAVVPVSIIRLEGDTMVFKAGRCPSGVFAAMTVITQDPVTYQVKGIVTGAGGNCRLKVSEIYSGGVPLPGRRIS
jgi:hypothetical protein